MVNQTYKLLLVIVAFLCGNRMQAQFGLSDIISYAVEEIAKSSAIDDMITQAQRGKRKEGKNYNRLQALPTEQEIAKPAFKIWKATSIESAEKIAASKGTLGAQEAFRKFLALRSRYTSRPFLFREGEADTLLLGTAPKIHQQWSKILHKREDTETLICDILRDTCFKSLLVANPEFIDAYYRIARCKAISTQLRWLKWLTPSSQEFNFQKKVELTISTKELQIRETENSLLCYENSTGRLLAEINQDLNNVQIRSSRFLLLPLLPQATYTGENYSAKTDEQGRVVELDITVSASDQQLEIARFNKGVTPLENYLKHYLIDGQQAEERQSARDRRDLLTLMPSKATSKENCLTSFLLSHRMVRKRIWKDLNKNAKKAKENNWYAQFVFRITYTDFNSRVPSSITIEQFIDTPKKVIKTRKTLTS